MCLRLRPNRSIPGSGLLNLKERTHPSSSGRRRCPLEGVLLAELGRGHQELSSAGQRQGTHLIGQYHLTLFSRSIYLQAVALLQPSNILPRGLHTAAVCNSNRAKRSQAWSLPAHACSGTKAMGCNGSNGKTDTESCLTIRKRCN